MATTPEDRELLRRLRALKRIEGNPGKYPTAIHKAAVDKLNRVRLIVRQEE